MSPTTWRNILVAPLVIPLRVAIIGPLWLLVTIGNGAEWLWDRVGPALPGLRYEPPSSGREKRGSS